MYTAIQSSEDLLCTVLHGRA